MSLSHIIISFIVEVASNQEEADLRVILHALNALESDKVESVIIRSLSGDVDKCFLVIRHLYLHKEKVFLDNGKSDARQLILLSSKICLMNTELPP